MPPLAATAILIRRIYDSISCPHITHLLDISINIYNFLQLVITWRTSPMHLLHFHALAISKLVQLVQYHRTMYSKMQSMLHWLTHQTCPSGNNKKNGAAIAEMADTFFSLKVQFVGALVSRMKVLIFDVLTQSECENMITWFHSIHYDSLLRNSLIKSLNLPGTWPVQIMFYHMESHLGFYSAFPDIGNSKLAGAIGRFAPKIFRLLPDHVKNRSKSLLLPEIKQPLCLNCICLTVGKWFCYIRRATAFNLPENAFVNQMSGPSCNIDIMV